MNSVKNGWLRVGLIIPLVSIMLLAAFALLQEDVNAETIASGECGEAAFWVLDDQGTLTISGEGAMADYTMNNPSPWLYNKEQINSIIIDEGITVVGAFAFNNCSKAVSIEIADSVTDIGTGAFKSTRVKTVVLSDNIRTIGRMAFQSCTELESAIIGSGVDTVPSSLFYNCLSLSEITLPDTITSIGSNAFSSCISLTALRIPPNVMSIGGDIVENCSNLETIAIQCSAPVTVGPPNAFADFSGTIYFPSNDVFWDEETRAAWAPNATWIPEGEIEIRVIDQGDCGEHATWTVTNQGILTISGEGEMNDYGYSSNEAPWRGKKYVIRGVIVENGITKIGNNSFYDCRTIERVEVADSVTEIGKEAFFGNTKLSTIILSNNLAKIGDHAFYNSGLKEITIPSSVRTIGRDVFAFSNQLEKAIIEEGVQEISVWMFGRCENLKQVSIPETVVTIGYGAFNNCSSLTSVRLSHDNMYVGLGAFDGCRGLETVVFKCSPPIRLSDGEENAFQGFSGTAYYPAEDETWDEETRNAWAPNATWKDTSTLTYDAGFLTELVDENTGTITNVNGSDVEEFISKMELVQPEHIVVNAKPEESADSVVTSQISLPVVLAKACKEVGASLAADAAVGIVELDTESIAGAIADDEGTIEITITNEGTTDNDLTVFYNVEMNVVEGTEVTNVTDLEGKAHITVPVPTASIESDTVLSYYQMDGQDAEELTTSRTASTVTVETRKLGVMRNTANDFCNFDVSINPKTKKYINAIIKYTKKEVKIYDKDDNALKASQYDFSCTKKAVGTYTLTIKGKGKYSGKTNKKGKYTIKPKDASITGLSVGTGKITVKMSRTAKASGGTGCKYEIKYKATTAKRWKTTTATGKTKTIKGLKKGKKYNVKVTAVKNGIRGKTSSKTSGKVK